MPDEVKAPSVQPRSVVDEVAAAIRHGVEARIYPPGTHLVERTIAKSLDVSSIAVREAFGRLTKEGLLVHKARRGVYVASPSAEEFDDIARVRVSLEQLVVELASTNWDAEATESVQRLVDGMGEAAKENDAERFFELDSRFHDVFWQVASSPILLEIAALLRGRLSGFIREAILQRSHDELLQAVTMHQEWLDAVANGDIPMAKDEVQRQIESTSRQIIASLKDVEGPVGE